MTIVGSAAAQTVYRCGSAYSDKPCPGAKVVDATPDTGMDVRTSGGAVVHSRAGDKARGARSLEVINENSRNAVHCGLSGEAIANRGGHLECPASKAKARAQRATPDYIR